MLSLSCIKFARGPAATMSIDILKGLFEQHFHAPPERVQPLQGQLGGSGRIIVRLSGGEQNKVRLSGGGQDSAPRRDRHFV
jgi:hypothetical protein